jgi:hypothetical protein
MQTDWRVPQGPTNNGGLNYIFNGLNGSSGIIQPVLQYGFGPNSGSGNFWIMQNWWVDYSGNFVTGTLRYTYPGDMIRGILTSNYCTTAGSCSWNIGFSINGGTQFFTTISGLQPFGLAVRTLESYDVGSCSQLPYLSSWITGFQNINFTNNYVYQPSSTNPNARVERDANVTWGINGNSPAPTPSCSRSVTNGTRAATMWYQSW